MRSIFKAIARAFRAAMGALKWVRDETGKLVLKLVGGGASMELPDPYDAVIEEQPARPVEQGYDQLRAAAEALARGGVPSPEVLEAVGEHGMRWLSAMPREMLQLIVTASDKQIGEHMKQIKSIRGLLAYDVASIKAYKKAVARDRKIEMEEAARARRIAEHYYA